MNNAGLPDTLGGAIATEPIWLQAWVAVLSFTLICAILFVPHRVEGRWTVRIEPVAILASAFVAVIIMDWLYSNYGYVRLLGLAHLLAWTPVYFWIAKRRAEIGWNSLYGKYVHIYLIVAGLSLVIDAFDVVRYLIGDGELYLRWALV